MTETNVSRSGRRESLREERLEVLRLFEAGTVDLDQTAALLEALDRGNRAEHADGSSGGPVEPGPPLPGSGWLVRIRITDGETNQTSVNLAVPLALVESGLEIAGQFAPDYLPSAETIRESALGGFRGHLLDVQDAATRVEIVVE